MNNKGKLNCQEECVLYPADIVLKSSIIVLPFLTMYVADTATPSGLSSGNVRQPNVYHHETELWAFVETAWLAIVTQLKPVSNLLSEEMSQLKKQHPTIAQFRQVDQK